MRLSLFFLSFFPLFKDYLKKKTKNKKLSVQFVFKKGLHCSYRRLKEKDVHKF